MIALEVNAAKNLDDYPSGSAIEYFEGKIYLLGDDAQDLLVLDGDWNEVQRIQLFSGRHLKRIAKAHKADLEATTVISLDQRPHVLAVGSGSRPTRNGALLLDLITLEPRFVDLSPFYARLEQAGLKQLNIEGLASVRERVVLANRGNKQHPDNHLIVAAADFVAYAVAVPFYCLLLEFDAGATVGVSGLAYSPENDSLYVTASTEETANNYDDGAIGSSYLGVIFNATERLNDTHKLISCDKWLELPKQDDRFEGQKIESVCIETSSAAGATLHMVADNDAGNTQLFRITIRV